MTRVRRGLVAAVAALSLSGAWAAQASAAFVWHPNERSFAETSASGLTVRACDGDAGDGHRVRAWIRWGTVDYASPLWAGPSGGCTPYWNPPSSIGWIRICVEEEGCSAWQPNDLLAAARR